MKTLASARGQWGIFASAVLIALAILYAGGERPPAQPQAPSAPQVTQIPATIESLRAEREVTRKDRIAALQTLTKDADKEISRTAKQQLLELVHTMEQETGLEVLLRAKGLRPVMVLHQGDAVHILTTMMLDEPTSLMAMELACSETGLAAKNIKIVFVENDV